MARSSGRHRSGPTSQRAGPRHRRGTGRSRGGPGSGPENHTMYLHRHADSRLGTDPNPAKAVRHDRRAGRPAHPDGPHHPRRATAESGHACHDRCAEDVRCTPNRPGQTHVGAPARDETTRAVGLRRGDRLVEAAGAGPAGTRSPAKADFAAPSGRRVRWGSVAVWTTSGLTRRRKTHASARGIGSLRRRRENLSCGDASEFRVIQRGQKSLRPRPGATSIGSPCTAERTQRHRSRGDARAGGGSIGPQRDGRSLFKPRERDRRRGRVLRLAYDPIQPTDLMLRKRSHSERPTRRAKPAGKRRAQWHAHARSSGG